MDQSTHDLIISLYRSGKYPIAIRAETGYSLTQIYRVLHKEPGLTLRSQSESHRRHQMDFSFFEKIDSHEKAQVLGFIYADGCVPKDMNRITIGIAHEDHDYLEYIKRVTKYTGSVRVYAARRDNEQPLSWISLCSPKMVQDIVKLGCEPRKSLTLQFPIPDQVPDEFLCSFMLGYFEGDGSISSLQRSNRQNHEYTLTICGTDTFCARFAEILKVPIRVIHPPKDKIAMLRVDGNRQVKRSLDFLYSHAPYTLKRKKMVYDKLCAQLAILDDSPIKTHPA